MKLAKLDDGPEIFHTIQGEGVSAGLPAIFVRGSRCNLHCRWCDTDYTWNFKGTPWTHERDGQPGFAKHRKEDVTFEISAADLAARLAGFHCRRVVLTGGEPLIQEDAWIELIDRLRAGDPRWVFEVETNGTRTPSAAGGARIDQFNVSPKLANSGMDAALRIVPEALEWFAGSPRAWFKFVVDGDDDIAEIRDLVARFAIPGERVLLMPKGRTAAELAQTSETVARLCLEHGWRFGDRLHVRLWDDRRGV